MREICVGVHVHAEPEGLGATLASLRDNTTRSFDLLLLPDGPDGETAAALQALDHLDQSGTLAALGPPACFNRLAASTDASLLVLLESGAQVGPGWLDLLIAALSADPSIGLAGPSTNRSWNRQGLFPDAGTSAAEVAATARAAMRRFGLEARLLGPLHDLADFCFAVHRRVIDAIGAADEGYGLGPCWEMDYSARAARAGFKAVWALGAYVSRAPFTTRRAHAETRLLAASRRRYQDAFCALRLRAERTDHEPHCRGEACEHFAPPDLIAVQRRAPGVAPTQDLTPSALSAVDAWSEDGPLVSCILPTGGRPDFVLQSVRYFQRQDYRRRELVIVDDGSDGLAALLPDDERVRYVRCPAGLSIGTKRNRACELARGEVIAHWDDDDWYAPRRLRQQVASLGDGRAELSALHSTIFFDLPAWRFWRCNRYLHRRLFVADVHGGTLVYRRDVWERLSRYPDTSLAEDAVFLAEARRQGARLHRQSGEGLFIYVRHGDNAWSFSCGYHLDPSGWTRVPEPPLPDADRAFYASRSPCGPGAPVHPAPAGRSAPQPSVLRPLIPGNP